MSDQAEGAAHRDVGAFDERAPDYDSGWRGRMHHRISDRVCEIAVAIAPGAERILDVGCGTGYLLSALGAALPGARELVGVDASANMVRVATESRDDPRAAFAVGAAEQLPTAGGFDLVVSSTSFDHWRDQRAGLSECARVLTTGGRLVLCDLFSSLLVPTLVGDRRRKARTRRRAEALLHESGLVAPEWHDVYTPLIHAVSAQKP